MFNSASQFNGDITGWNTGAVTNMTSMFASAPSFNRNIGSWNITAVANMTTMFSGTVLPSTTYDSILNGWAAQTVKTAVPFHGGSSVYTAASTAARATLTGTKAWTITDGGGI